MGNIRKNLQNILIIIILVIFSIATLLPIGILIYTTAGKGSSTFSVVPHEQRNIIENYKIVLQEKHLPRFFLNSIVISFFVTFLSLFIGSLAAFAFSKLNFRFRNLLYKVILIGIMLPAGIITVPLFLFFNSINMVGNLFSVILIESGLFVPFIVLILKNYIDSLPKELFDAASIDGCNNFQLYYKIILPLSRPSLTAVGIFVLMWSWNEYFIPLIFLRKPELQTVQMAPQFYYSMFNADLPLYFASMVVVIIPIIIVYFIFQNQFVEGLTAGALKE